MKVAIIKEDANNRKSDKQLTGHGPPAIDPVLFILPELPDESLFACRRKKHLFRKDPIPVWIEQQLTWIC